MSYDVADSLPGDRAAIVIYRNLQDAVRTHFSEKNGAGAFLEAPLQAYYGNRICCVYMFSVRTTKKVHLVSSLASCFSSVLSLRVSCGINSDCMIRHQAI